MLNICTQMVGETNIIDEYIIITFIVVIIRYYYCRHCNQMPCGCRLELARDEGASHTTQYMLYYTQKPTSMY